MSKEFSKKRKVTTTVLQKQQLWNVFEQEIISESGVKNEPLECVYQECGNREKCELCGTILVYSDEGFLACTNNSCGIIYKDMINQTAEWRFYGADDNNSSDPTRCGMPINPLLKESSYGCKILSNTKSSYEMRKIKRYTEWQSMPYKEKSQYDEFQRIAIMAQNVGIPKMIIDNAIYYHKKISDHSVTFRGTNRDGIIAASIYISCRKNNFPRTAKEIATIFHLDIASTTKGCKNAQIIINELEKDMLNEDKTMFNKTTPSSFIQRFCSKLQINNELSKLCNFISLKVDSLNLISENTPHSIAAGIIYYIVQLCNLNITKKDIKNISEISEVTINKCYKKIEKIKDQIVPPSILVKYDKQDYVTISV